MRKLCAMFIIFALALTAVVSCGEKAERVTNVFRAEEIALPDGFSPAGLAFYDGGYAVSAADDTGSKLFRFDGSGLVSETPIESYGENIAAFPDGRVVSAGGDFIEIVYPDGTTQTEKTDVIDCGDVISIACADDKLLIATQSAAAVFDDELVHLFSLSDGQIRIAVRAGDRFALQELDRATMKYRSRYIDTEARDYGESFEFTGSLIDSATGLSTLSDNDVSDTDGVICDLINSDLLKSRILRLKVVDRDTILAHFTVDFESTAYLLKRVPESEIVPKKLIHVAMSETDLQFCEKIVTFNMSDPEYRVVVDDYSRLNTSENKSAGAEKLKNDIVSGYRPDLMLFIPKPRVDDYRDEYTRKGLLADMYELIESDVSFSREDIPGGVRRNGETDAKLLYLPLEYRTISFAVRGCDSDGWTLREFLDWAKDNEPVLNAYSGGEPDLTLYLLLTCSMEEFIDADGNVKFDSELFRDALEYAKNSAGMKLDDGIACTTGINQVDLCTLRLKLGDDARIVGFPDTDGNGTLMNVYKSVSIVKDSKEKGGAWKFVKSLLKSETEEHDGVEIEYYSTPDGTSTTRVTKKEGVTSNLDSENFIRIYPEKEAERARELLDGVGTSLSYDSDLFNLIAEDASAYFAGAKSLDETVKIIQNRVETYIAERN